MNEVIDKIVKENITTYGEIQKCCGLYKYWCRCGVETEVTKALKEKSPVK